MAPRVWKRGDVPMGALILLALVVGLALPAIAAGQAQRAPSLSGLVMCRRFHPDQNKLLPKCHYGSAFASIQGCCTALSSVSANECSCGIRRFYAEKNIDFSKVCNITGLEEKCKPLDEEVREARKEVEAQNAAQKREEQLSKLDPCGRVFERLAANEVPKIKLQDARTCAKVINDLQDQRGSDRVIYGQAAGFHVFGA